MQYSDSNNLVRINHGFRELTMNPYQKVGMWCCGAGIYIIFCNVDVGRSSE